MAQTPDEKDLKEIRDIVWQVWIKRATISRSQVKFLDLFTDDPDHEWSLQTCMRLLDAPEDAQAAFRHAVRKRDLSQPVDQEAEQAAWKRHMELLAAWLKDFAQKYEKAKSV